MLSFNFSVRFLHYKEKEGKKEMDSTSQVQILDEVVSVSLTEKGMNLFLPILPSVDCFLGNATNTREGKTRRHGVSNSTPEKSTCYENAGLSLT